MLTNSILLMRTKVKVRTATYHFITMKKYIVMPATGFTLNNKYRRLFIKNLRPLVNNHAATREDG